MSKALILLAATWGASCIVLAVLIWRAPRQDEIAPPVRKPVTVRDLTPAEQGELVRALQRERAKARAADDPITWPELRQAPVHTVGRDLADLRRLRATDDVLRLVGGGGS